LELFEQWENSLLSWALYACNKMFKVAFRRPWMKNGEADRVYVYNPP
jgi:hypothetical protein